MAMRAARVRKKEPDLFINRELSWLAFNYRVLEEAMDPTVPLLDRLKFAIIVSGNLDEFFMVRVAGLKHAIEEGDTTPDLAGLTPRQQLHVVSERAHEMVDMLGQTLTEQILPALAEQGVRVVTLGSLEAPQRAHLSRYFRSEVLPALTPLAIDASRPFPRLANLTFNLGVLLAPAEGEEQPRLGVVQVPAGLRRLVRPLGGDGNTYVLLEEIIRAELATLFPGQTGVGDALLAILVERLEIEVPDVFYVRSPLDIRALQPLVDLPSLEHLRESPLKPLPVLEPGEMADLFGRLR